MRTYSIFAGLVLIGNLCAQSKSYLPVLSPQDLLQFVPAPPVIGDSRDVLDRATFRATRASETLPRWLLAQSDNDITAAGLANAFSCNLGFQATAANDPKLFALLGRTINDTNASIAKVKGVYKRRRPFTIDEGSICIPKDEYLTNSFDYPSGHSTVGWVVGLIFAELFPDRGARILTRARQYGESRVFCGVHNVSAVESARTVASGIVAMLHGSAEFRHDLQAARSELAHKKQDSLASAKICQEQIEVLAQSPYVSISPKH